MKFYLQYYSGQCIIFLKRWFTLGGIRKQIKRRKGKKEAEFFAESLQNLGQHIGDKKAAATLKVVESSNKKSKNKRIIAFDPKRKASIAKRKLSNHQLATAVEGENREALKGSALKINKKKMRVEHA